METEEEVGGGLLVVVTLPLHEEFVIVPFTVHFGTNVLTVVYVHIAVDVLNVCPFPQSIATVVAFVTLHDTLEVRGIFPLIGFTEIELHAGGRLGGGTTITHGSVVGHTGVPHPGLETEAILVMTPLIAVTLMGRVIFGKNVFAPIEATLVHTIEVVPVHIHPGADIGPTSTTPVGKTSVTVVVPVVGSGHSFFTLSIYSNISPVLSITAPLTV